MAKPRWKYETNLSKEQIIDKFLIRYLSKNNIICSGYIFQPSEITTIKVYETNTPLEFVKQDDIEKDRVIHQQGKNVTGELFDLAKRKVRDPISGIENPANYLVLSYSVILSVYAFIEIMQVWVDTQVRAGRS
jgi:hypothetical protein